MCVTIDLTVESFIFKGTQILGFLQNKKNSSALQFIDDTLIFMRSLPETYIRRNRISCSTYRHILRNKHTLKIKDFTVIKYDFC